MAVCSRGVGDGVGETVCVAGQVGAHGDDCGATETQLAVSGLPPADCRREVGVAGSRRHEQRHVEADHAAAVQSRAGALSGECQDISRGNVGTVK